MKKILFFVFIAMLVAFSLVGCKEELTIDEVADDLITTGKGAFLFNGVKYATLQEAVDFVEGGGTPKSVTSKAADLPTITLIRNVSDAGAIISSDLRLDFGSYTYVLNNSATGIQLADGASEVEFTSTGGGKIIAGTDNTVGGIFNSTNPEISILLDSVEIDVSNTELSAVSAEGGSIEIAGTSKIKADEGKTAIDVSGTTIAVKGSSSVSGTVKANDAKLSFEETSIITGTMDVTASSVFVSSEGESKVSIKMSESSVNIEEGGKLDVSKVEKDELDTSSFAISENATVTGSQDARKTINDNISSSSEGVAGLNDEAKQELIDSGHEHSADESTWYSNAKYHWHVCSECGEPIELIEHSFQSKTEDGVTILTCETCSFEVKKIEISFDSNGGTGSMESFFMGVDEVKKLTANSFEKEGYTFTGWATGKTSEKVYDDKGTVENLTNNIKLYAVWTANEYTVTFDAGEGSVDPSSKTVTYDDVYGELPVATRDNYNFAGWYSDTTEETEYKADSKVKTAENHTLYAHWKDFAITFDANGGEGTMDKVIANNGETVTLPESVFTKDDGGFDGWATTKDGPKVYEDESEITVTGNMTLYAVWVDMVSLEKLNSNTLEGGITYTIEDDYTINERLEINGKKPVTILLPEGKTLTLSKGISVTSGKSLTIEGDGKLIATGETDNHNGSAGIGGSMSDRSNGTVTIKGGIVETTGGYGAAGIGGGYYLGWEGNGGSVIISGGTVTAKGGDYGSAGIGGSSSGAGGNVTISGGIVNAIGASSGAGIGGGSGANGGTVKITGGVVTATGGSEGAGIGGGALGGSGGTVEISGELTSVTAIGGYGAAGIGGGPGQYSVSRDGGNGGNVTISGGSVTATGGEHGAGIGGGAGNITRNAGNGGTVTISGGSVTATGGEHGAGIGGGGNHTDGNGGAGGTVTITGGTITAIGKTKAAGIGGGGSDKYLGGGVGGTIIITSGTVQATGGSTSGIGIGGGRGSTTRSNDGSLKIGSDLGLYGGANQASSQFRSFPTESYVGERYTYMEARPAGFVTITYDGNGGTGEMADQIMVKGEADIALSANAFTTPNPDLVFSGWAESSTGNVVYSDAGNIAFSEDTTLYAIWGEKVIITESMKNLVAGAEHTILGDVTNTYRLSINGGDSATIDLPDGMTLKLTNGLRVQNGKTLTINAIGENGSGTMIATGGTHQAGIGGDMKEDGGSIIINGGTITATGNGKAAGIGAGGIGDGSSHGRRAGNLTVTGGTVTAYGGDEGGAGIGGGKGASLTPPGSGGTVTISGGSVTAYGRGVGGAGIGGGMVVEGDTSIIINITGGTVTATGSQGGAGIGGFKDCSGGVVSITGGSVTATGDVFYSSIGTGIGRGGSGADDGTLTLENVSMQVSDNGTSWSAYDGTNRHKYMKIN